MSRTLIGMIDLMSPLISVFSAATQTSAHLWVPWGPKSFSLMSVGDNVNAEGSDNPPQGNDYVTHDKQPIVQLKIIVHVFLQSGVGEPE